MDLTSPEIAHDFRPFFCVYKDGRVERLQDTPIVPPADDPLTGVKCKDVVISPEVSARMYLPKTDVGKLPVLVYIHGGAFAIESAFSTLYHHYLNSLAAAANVVAVSIEYRRAPEHPIPACYDDSWTALQWVALHKSKRGPEPWLNDFADLDRIFLAGDSAGANIAHDLAIRTGFNELGPGVNLSGVILVHPFFGNNEPNKLWMFLCKETSGIDDPRLNPAADPGLLKKIGCTRVLICVGERDFLRESGLNYYEALKKSEWSGLVEIKEIEGEEHVFHLFKPTCEKAGILMNQIVSFVNQE